MLKPERKHCIEWAQFKTSEDWQLALLELLAPNLSSAHWCNNPSCKASVSVRERCSVWPGAVLEYLCRQRQTGWIIINPNPGIRSRDYHSSVRETTAFSDPGIVQKTYSQPDRPPRPPSCFLQVCLSSVPRLLIPISAAEDFLSADSLSLQEFKCDTNSVLLMLRAMTALLQITVSWA